MVKAEFYVDGKQVSSSEALRQGVAEYYNQGGDVEEIKSIFGRLEDEENGEDARDMFTELTGIEVFVSYDSID